MPIQGMPDLQLVVDSVTKRAVSSLGWQAADQPVSERERSPASEVDVKQAAAPRSSSLGRLSPSSMCVVLSSAAPAPQVRRARRKDELGRGSRSWRTIAPDMGAIVQLPEGRVCE